MDSVLSFWLGGPACGHINGRLVLVYCFLWLHLAFCSSTSMRQLLLVDTFGRNCRLFRFWPACVNVPPHLSVQSRSFEIFPGRECGQDPGQGRMRFTNPIVSNIRGKQAVFQHHAVQVQDKVDITKHKHGDVLDGTVYSVQKYGALVKLADKSTGLLHISQISHERVQDVAQVFAVGDFVKAMFLTVDQERLTLSTKQLEHRPGDMLRDPQLVYEKAKDAAAAYLQHRAKLPWMKKGSAAPRAASARGRLAGGGGRHWPMSLPTSVISVKLFDVGQHWSAVGWFATACPRYNLRRRSLIGAWVQGG
eukprot:294183-Chlamydomonas_euryale.AAC.2